MKLIAVVSGKGGTGKTSLVASLTALAQGRAVVADCDVDAPDLHLILRPEIKERREFLGIKRAVIDSTKCTFCGSCEEHCRFKAIDNFVVDSLLCEGCKVCSMVCPAEAVSMVDRLSGYAYVSETRFGPLVHADLFPGEEASGKLVAMVRELAREQATSRKLDLILIDGSPGIGCPVLASLTGVDIALVVTEPTVSAVHDLERILGVAEHFQVKSAVCINKYDLNPDVAHHIEEICSQKQIKIVGKLPFDQTVVKAMVLGEPVVKIGGPAAEGIRELWRALELCL
jgi:MinD superfamily P-loop ATPase